MKRILSLLLAVLLTLALAACGESQPESTAGAATGAATQPDDSNNGATEPSSTVPGTDDPTAETIPAGSFFNETHYTVEEQEPFNGTVYQEFETRYRLKEAAENNLLPEVLLEETSIILCGTKVSELREKGWELEISIATLDSKMRYVCVATAPSGNKALIGFTNNTDSTISVAECLIDSIDLSVGNALYRGAKGCDFSYAGHLSFASSPRDITGTLGEPGNFTVYKRIPYEGASYSTILIDYRFYGDLSATFTFHDDGSTIQLTSVTFSDL